jgi:uncharacterized delta-60 repeat protein
MIRAAMVLIAVVTTAAVPTLAHAQSANDAFNPGANGEVNAMALQADGRLIVGGAFTMLGGGSGTTPRQFLGRLLVDGSVDPSFDPGANGPVFVIVVQTDGRILVAGAFTTIGGGGAGTTARNFLARLNADGSVDAGFNPGVNAGVSAIALQPDGRILVGGDFTMIGGGGTGNTPRSRIARLNQDGSVDGTFNPGASGQVSTIALQPDGSCVVGGSFAFLGGGGIGTTPRDGLGRLLADGTLDATFSPTVGGVVLDLLVQDDGRILVAGVFTTLNGVPRSRIGRLFRSGALDPAFDPGVNDLILAMALQPDDQVIVSGVFTTIGGGGSGTTPRAGLARLRADGSVDQSFDPGPAAPLAAIVQDDGSILIGGSFTTLMGSAGLVARNHLARLHANGTLDEDFNPGADSSVFAIAVQPDGRIVVGGDFTALGGSDGQTVREFIGRINPNGAIDAAFNPGANGPVYAIVLQPDGKMVVAGDFTMLGGGGTGTTQRRFIGRLNADGTLDAGFNPGADGPVRALALQPDGRILVGGFFMNLGGGTGTTPRHSIGRLHPNGDVDGSFDPGTNGAVWTLAVEPDAQILVGGTFTAVGGGTGITPRFRLARINADASVDPQFNPGANESVYAMAVQSDGRIVVGGFFTQLGGGGQGSTSRHRLGRLFPDGSLDTSFNPGANGAVLSLVADIEGRTIVAGSFTSLGGGDAGVVVRNRIGRLLPDGALDPAFDPGASATVYSLTFDGEGRLLVGGAFTSLGGGFLGATPRSHLGRLPRDSEAGSEVAVTGIGSTVFWERTGALPEVGRVSFEVSTDGVSYTLLGAGARKPAGWELTGLELPTNQSILIRARGHTIGGVFAASSSIVERTTGAYIACPTVGPTSAPAGFLGTPYSLTFTADGALGSVIFVIDGVLPAGLALLGNVLSGTPGQIGTFPFTVIVTDTLSGCSGARAFTLTIGFPSNDVTAFDPGANGDVWALAIQPDGKVLIGGDFTQVGGGGSGSSVRMHLARLAADGALDLSFNPGATGPVYALAVQPDGRILVGGEFLGIGGGTGTVPRARIARLMSDGSVDPTFDPGADGSVFALFVQRDGSILAGGAFTSLAGETRRRIGRLSAAGVLDAGFNPGADSWIYTVLEQEDGRVLVGGEFTKLGGGTGTVSRRYVGRLEANGLLDSSFDPGADAPVLTLTTQADGRILLGGWFTGLGGSTGTTVRNFIGRLENDGSVDSSFDPGANDLVWALAPATDGSILVGGDFTMLGGGGAGTTSRKKIGRLDGAGAIDVAFNPGADSTVAALAVQVDGRVIAGGNFSAMGGGTGTTARSRIAQLAATSPAADELTFTNGGTEVTWTRTGSGPEISTVAFESSTDGTTYAPLGVGTRVSNGWEITGISLPNHPNLRVRASGRYLSGGRNGSMSIASSSALPVASNAIENGDFSAAMTAWTSFATPDPSYIVSGVVNGVLEFYRVPPPPGTSNQAVVFQNTGLPLEARSVIEAEFDAGNSSSVRKRLSVLIHDGDFSDLSVCTFWLAPNSPLQTYRMRMQAEEDWINATISFYAASAGSSGGFYRLDNVSLERAAVGPIDRTECIDPNAPVPPGGPPEGSLLGNGDFSGAGLAPWGVFGTITWRIAGGLFEFYRPAGTPAGVVLQQTAAPMLAGTILTATLELGNTSTVRKRVTVLLHDANFSDLAACTFWLPSQAVSKAYTVRAYATQNWTNATISVYPSTVGAEPWISLDNVTFQRTPASVALGTECLWPSSPMDAVAVETPDSLQTEPARVRGRSDVIAPAAPAFPVALPDANTVLDLRAASAATMAFDSWLDSGVGLVQISPDGVSWETAYLVPSSDEWMPVEVDLAPFAGRAKFIRWRRDAIGEPQPIGIWRIRNLIFR